MHNTATKLSLIDCIGNYIVKISRGHSRFNGGHGPFAPLGYGPDHRTEDLIASKPTNRGRTRMQVPALSTVISY